MSKFFGSKVFTGGKSSFFPFSATTGLIREFKRESE